MLRLQKIFKTSLSQGLFSTKKIQPVSKYSEKHTKARTVMQLYNLKVSIAGDCFIAPNATVVGEVFIGHQSSIWHGTVVRGDINAVMYIQIITKRIHANVFIGNNCVLHTAASTTSGLQAALQIQDDCVIQHGCTLYSCILKEKAYIGHNTVILEGAIIEEGAIISPNSVVPPGRLVPAMQVWGGNPIKFIRYVKEQEAWVTLEQAREQYRSGFQYKKQFLAYNNSYLYKPTEASDQQFELISTTNPTDRQESLFEYDPQNSTLN